MIWLIGKKGMLGNEVEKLLKKDNISYIASDKEVDITNYPSLERYEEDKKIEWIINCSAYTQVDKAEEEEEKAFKINRDGVRNISRVALKRRAKLLHISTDYVFDGEDSNKVEPLGYNEEDKTNPINVYGKSKLAGEKEIEKYLDKYFTVRTSWLYGLEGNNFIYTMLRLFREREVVRVVDDQIGSPTYTADLAGVILKIINSNSSSHGLYHFTNEGITSWYKFARAIYDKSVKLGLIERERRIEIISIKTEDYPTKAKRPKYSVLSKRKIKREFHLNIRNWEEALEDFLFSLKRNQKRLGR
jgi:dTDP-4-dehydrorhamnose reductase